jgi:hypothetical protein
MSQLEAQGTAAPIKIEILGYQPYLFRRRGSYLLRLEFPSGETQRATFKPAQMASLYAFSERLWDLAPGARWTGNSRELDRFIQQQMRNIKLLPLRLF